MEDTDTRSMTGIPWGRRYPPVHQEANGTWRRIWPIELEIPFSGDIKIINQRIAALVPLKSVVVQVAPQQLQLETESVLHPGATEILYNTAWTMAIVEHQSGPIARINGVPKSKLMFFWQLKRFAV